MCRYVGMDISEYCDAGCPSFYIVIRSAVSKFQKVAFSQTLKSRNKPRLPSSIDILHNTVICDYKPKLEGIFKLPLNLIQGACYVTPHILLAGAVPCRALFFLFSPLGYGLCMPPSPVAFTWAVSNSTRAMGWSLGDRPRGMEWRLEGSGVV